MHMVDAGGKQVTVLNRCDSQECVPLTALRLCSVSWGNPGLFARLCAFLARLWHFTYLSLDIVYSSVLLSSTFYFHANMVFSILHVLEIKVAVCYICQSNYIGFPGI